jgi:hypothetical protein
MKRNHQQLRVISLNIQVHYNGRPSGTIPFSALASTILYFNELGLESNWDKDNRILHVTNSLYNKKIFVYLEQVTESDTMLVEELKKYLQYVGVKTEITEENSLEGLSGDLFVRLIVKPSNNQGKDEGIFIGVNKRLYWKELKEKVYPELKQYHIKGQEIFTKEDTNIPLLSLSINIGEHEMNSNLPISLANVVTRLLLKKKNVSMIDLSIDAFKHLLMADTLERKTEKKKVEKQRERQSITEEVKEVTKKVIKSCDMYFDYSISKNQHTNHYTIVSDIWFKNIGNINLKNPTVCIRTNPPGNVEIGGQILPPTMSELFSVQGSQGAQGWQYIGEDWLEKAYETGEYWVKPLQEITIKPGEEMAMEQVKFTLEPLEEKGDITIVGFVYFQEQKLQFSSLNKIIFSF